MAENLLSSWVIITSSGRTLLHRVSEWLC